MVEDLKGARSSLNVKGEGRIVEDLKGAISSSLFVFMEERRVDR